MSKMWMAEKDGKRLSMMPPTLKSRTVEDRIGQIQNRPIRLSPRQIINATCGDILSVVRIVKSFERKLSKSFVRFGTQKLDAECKTKQDVYK